MKSLTRIGSLTGMLAIASCALMSTPALAQSTVTPSSPGRFFIELKDASLADSLELIFKAAGNPSHIIDEAAQAVNIGNFTLTNIAWDSAVRQLANANNFKVSRNETGAYVIESRTPVANADGTPGAVPFAPTGGAFAGGAPANPFGGAPGQAFNGARPLLLPRLETMSNAQTRPNLGGRGGSSSSADSSAEKEYRIIPVQHIYAGGLAQLFSSSSVIRTEDFVSPGSSGGSGGSGGNRGGRTGVSNFSGGSNAGRSGSSGFGGISSIGGIGGTTRTGTSGFGGFGF